MNTKNKKIKVSYETMRFIQFVQVTKPDFEIREQQVKVLNEFFKLRRGEGKTTLIRYLLLLDREIG